MIFSYIKGGFAGWGKPGEEDGVAILDEHDPNYVPEEEATEEVATEETVAEPAVTPEAVRTIRRGDNPDAKKNDLTSHFQTYSRPKFKPSEGSTLRSGRKGTVCAIASRQTDLVLQKKCK